MLKNYLKIAFKVFLRRKFFTFISLFGIGFTLAVLIVATSFLDHFFGPFPPEVKLDRTLFVFRIIPEYRPGEEGSTISYEISPFFAEEYLRPLHHVEKVSIFGIETDPITHFSSRGEKINSELKYTDAVFWQILEFDFLEGSGFTAQDLEQARHVAVINEATRGKVFGDEPAVGKVIRVDEQSFTVVGVVADVTPIDEGQLLPDDDGAGNDADGDDELQDHQAPAHEDGSRRSAQTPLQDADGRQARQDGGRIGRCHDADDGPADREGDQQAGTTGAEAQVACD